MRAIFVILTLSALGGAVCAQGTKIEPHINKKGLYALTLLNVESQKREIILDYEYQFISKANLIPDRDGPGRTPYFVVSKNGIWGAVDQKGEYVFQPSEADTMWLLRSNDAYKIRFADKSYNYVSIGGTVIASDIVDEKRSPYARYRILIKKDGTQSIIHRGKEVVKPIPYELDLDIQNRARTFLVKNKAGYHVINLDGFPLNDRPYEAATPIDFDGNLAVLENGNWYVLDKDLKRVDEVDYLKVEHRGSRFGQQSFYLCYTAVDSDPFVYAGEFPKLTSDKAIEGFQVVRAFGIGKIGSKWGYIAPETEGFDDFRYDTIEYSEKGHFYFHLIFGKIGSSYCLIDEAGKTYYEDVQIDKVGTMRCEQGARILLYQGEKIAVVYDAEKEPKPEFLYEDAQGSDKGFYLKKKGKWGMMDATGNIIADFTHSKQEDIKL